MPKDIYPNLAFGTVIEAVAGDIAFSQIQSGVPVFEKVAWLISRIEYFIGTTYMNLMIDEMDNIGVGVTISNSLLGFTQADPSLIDHVRVNKTAFGVAALYNMPIITDLSTLPGGGILLSPSPIFVAVMGISLAAVCGVQTRIYFTYIHLKPEEFWELVESRRIIS